MSEKQKNFYKFDDEGVVEPIEDLNSFFLWTTHQSYYEIFNIVRLYWSEMGGIAENILLRLIDHKKLDVEKALAAIPYMFSGYFEAKEQYKKE